jgi:tetratricopeptide (TPR) repeat protein
MAHKPALAVTKGRGSLDMRAGKLARFLSSLAVIALLAGCGGGQRDAPLESFTAEEIYKRGEFELETSRKSDEAARLFGEVERLYPYSEWAKRALIMQAFAFHKDRDYENSRAAAQRYIDTYPAEEDAAYAKYLLALSYYDQIDDVGRDQGLTFQALQALRAVIEEYPLTWPSTILRRKRWRSVAFTCAASTTRRQSTASALSWRISRRRPTRPRRSIG